MSNRDSCLPTFTLTQRYALAVTTTLARHPRTAYVPVEDLAREAHAPAPFLAKVLHTLAEARVVEGKKGHHGGYRLARNADRILLGDVVLPFCDAEKGVTPCIMGARPCSPDTPCALHTTWGEANRPLRELMRTLSLADVVRGALAASS